MLGEKNCRRIANRFQALIGHREYSEFVDRAESILHRANNAETSGAVTLEVQYCVNHVFENSWARKLPFFGYVAGEDNRCLALLGEAD